MLKRLLSLLAVALLLIGCVGCAPVQSVIDTLLGEEAVAAAEAIPHFGFSNGEVIETSFIITDRELSELPTEYTSYRGTVLFDSLSESERLIYRAYEYALENSYSNVLIDESLVDNTDRLYELLSFLSLDSPLMEQNICYELGTFTTYYPVQIYEWYEREACFEGYYVTVKNFDSDLWETKKQAIEKANEILSSLSLTDDMSDYQKAERIYRYINEHVVYEDYDYPDELTVYPYLHDALVDGHSHCDGFANAISLLMNMAQVTCVEKQYVSEDLLGHTWNFAYLDAGWVNIDGTYAEWVPDTDCSLSAGPGFAFSDLFQQQPPDHAECYETAASDIGIAPDAHLSSVSDAAFPSYVVNAYAEHQYEWAYIVVDECSEDALSAQMQQVANTLHTRIHYASFDMMNDRTAVLIYNETIYADS